MNEWTAPNAVASRKALLAKRLTAPTGGRRHTERKRKTTGNEDDLEWTKALSSMPPDRGSGRSALQGRTVSTESGCQDQGNEEGYGNAAHMEIEEKQKTFSLDSHNRLEKPKSGFSTFPQPRLLDINY